MGTAIDTRGVSATKIRGSYVIYSRRDFKAPSAEFYKSHELTSTVLRDIPSETTPATTKLR